MKKLTALAVCLIPALAACGVPVRTGTYSPPGSQAAPGTTFAWNEQRDRVVGDPRLENNQFFEDRLHEAIEWELALRGIRHDESSPDLMVHHHLTLADHEFVQEMYDEAGNPMSEVYEYEGGTVVVHLVNATTNATAGTGNWDIYINPAASGTNTPAATVVARNKATEFLTVPAGQSNTIRLTNAGQTAAVQNIAVPSLTAGTVTTIVVTDAATPGGTSLQVFTLPPCTAT